jgi:hypothetical protein
MIEKRARTQGAILEGLEMKITEAEEALLSAQKEHDVLVEAVARRTRNDALGQEAYSLAARREDAKVLRDLDGDIKQMTASLDTLRHTLPGVRHAAAKAELAALSRGLVESDADVLTPALQVFRGCWNGMLVSMAEVNKCFADRGILEAEFSKIRETLPKEDQAEAVAPAPPFTRAGFRNLLVWRGIDPSRFFQGLGRFVIQEADLCGQDRAPDPATAPENLT